MSIEEAGTRRVDPAVVAMGALLRAGEARAMARVVRALEKHGGNVWHATAELGVPHRTFMRWRQQIPALARAVEAARKRAKKAAS